MLEKRFYAVPPQLFTANGTSNGVVTIAAEACQLFKVNQRVLINASGLPTLKLQVKEIDGEGNVQVGPISGALNAPGGNSGITARSNISAYTIVLGANISADEQRRPDIDWSEAMRAMYDEEPAVAMRSILVDECGDRINAGNPLPVQFSSEFPNVVKVADGGGSGAELKVNPDGSINVNIESGGGGGVVNIFNQVTSVASGITTTVLTYTVPVGDTLTIDQIDVGGSNIALYEVNINSTLVALKRTWFGEGLNEDFVFDNYAVTAGSVVQITVLHNRPSLGDFEARIVGTLT